MQMESVAYLYDENSLLFSQKFHILFTKLSILHIAVEH